MPMDVNAENNMTESDIQVLSRVRLLVNGGIGHARIEGIKLDATEIDLASKLLAVGKLTIAGETSKARSDNQQMLGRIANKLSSGRLIILTPLNEVRLPLVESYDVTKEFVSIRFNPSYLAFIKANPAS